MKKKLLLSLALVAASCATVALATGCSSDKDVFNIYCWNDEFAGFFNKYVSDEGVKNNAQIDNVKTFHYQGKVVQWTKVTSDGGAYQTALDEALKNNAKAKKSEKVDLFLAEADYILKYTDSDLTADAKAAGVTVTDDQYEYTIDAASANGVMKGVSFQCCPSGMVYRRSIAKAVLGTDDPATVQEAVSDWTKFAAVAAQMKDAGYLMTGSYADTYRVFSNNAATPWVTNGTLTMPDVIKDWMDQAETFVANGYTKTDGVWDEGKTNEFKGDGKAFCTFGPAWYYNFCMGSAMGDGTVAGNEANNASYGDWAVIKGPQAHFWGGTWALLPAGGDDNELAVKVMNTIIGKDFSLNLLKNESQYTNNKTANAEYAKTSTGNGFLGGQNDTAIWNDMAGDIKFKNVTGYDQYCNEGLQTEFVKHLKDSSTTRDDALNSFYSYLKTTFGDTITIPSGK